MEASKVYSVAGLLGEDEILVTKRPFMSPHHTVTQQALAGGGRTPQPGIISLSHKGILFLDEIVHVPSYILELLRQPMEDKKIHIMRSKGSCIFPADFMLVASMNIATTKLIQCGTAEKAENKAFQGIGKVGYWILVSVAVKWNQSYLALCTSF